MAAFITSLLAPFCVIEAVPVGAVPPSVQVTDLLNSPITYLGHEIAVSAKVADV
jgi:hypothetical protein